MTGDPAFIAASLGVVARARAMTQLARDAGLSREDLYRTLSPEGDVDLGMVLRVLQALGLRLTVAPAAEEGPVQADAAAE